MTFIIAEIGINHNGSLELAKKLIDAAHWAGADAVKFQKRTVATVYAGQLDTPRESPWGLTLGAQKYGLEFNAHQYDEIAQHCKSLGMPWFASAWDEESLDFLAPYDCPWNKIASAMVTNESFVKAVARQGKPIFLSTAMSRMNQVTKAMLIVDRTMGSRTTIMHCVGTYPCPEKDLNLRMIDTLQREFPYNDIGYSGHEVSVSPSVMAVVLGAVAVERHLTLDRAMYGSDQAASLEPHGFNSMVEQIRKVETCLGDGIKQVSEAEQEVAKKLRYWER